MKLKDLKLDWPLDSRQIAQPFGGNYVATYVNDGLKGHPGIDFQITWGNPIYSASKGLGVAYKSFNKDNPDLSKYRAACELIELEDCVVELTYGHCDQILCKEGPLLPRQQIATVGNTGEVYYGTTLVTTAEKKQGSKKGAHLHFQMRVCYPKKSSKSNEGVLQEGDGSTYIHNGMYLTYPENGFRGCVDPMPYLVSVVDPIPELEQKKIGLIKQAIALAQQLLAKLLGQQK